MPPALPFWSAALASVGVGRQPGKQAGKMRLGYAFPDANVIAGSAANGGRYLVTWLSSRAACLWKQTNAHFLLFSDTMSQDWRSFLSRSLKIPLDSHGMPSSSAQALEAEGMTTAQRRKATASKFFADMALKDLPDTVYWQETAIVTGDIKSLQESLDPKITTEVLWELFEHNFRFEMLALDRMNLPRAWSHAEEHQVRDEKLRSVFFDENGRPGGSYLVEHVPDQNFGLAADNWEVRRLFVENLYCVMVAWPNPPVFPLKWDLGMPPHSLEARFLQFEKDVARHYCQAFYDMFGRAANVPHALKASSSQPLLAG